MEIKIEFKTDEEIKKEKSKPVEIKKISDLKKLLNEPNPRFLYGGVEFGALPSESEDDSEEDDSEEEDTMAPDAGDTETPDDTAEAEDPETRVKNSKYPTITGKRMA